MKLSASERLEASKPVLSGVEHSFISKFMTKQGYTLVGQGSQGSVWGEGDLRGLRVLKVMYKENSSEYMAFVDYVKAHPSKHAPKFFGSVVLPFSVIGHKVDALPPSRFTALVSVSVEKLSPLPKGFQASEKEEASFNEYVSPMHSFARSHSMAMDLHTGGNILLRGRTLVVADPFAPL